MTVRYYMDQNFHGNVTAGVRRRGIDRLTAGEDGRRAADDDLLLAHAVSLGRVMVSSDQDMVDIAEQWQREGRPFRAVLFGHQLRITVGRAIVDLVYFHDAAMPDDLTSRIFRLPL
jgi:predicted nuclease of predicted toxin-antitoxin system